MRIEPPNTHRNDRSDRKLQAGDGFCLDVEFHHFCVGITNLPERVDGTIMGHWRADMATEAFADTNARDGGFVGNFGEKELAQGCGAVPACFGCVFAVGIGDFGDISGEERSVTRPFGGEVDEENEDIGERGGFFVFLLLSEEHASWRRLTSLVADPYYDVATPDKRPDFRIQRGIGRILPRLRLRLAAKRKWPG